MSINLLIINDSCKNEFDLNYKQCIGKYCGRLLLNLTECLYSECGKCPRGFKPSNEGICEKCQNDAQIYDYMYLGFIYLLTLVFNFIFIDQSFLKSSDYKSPFTFQKFKVWLALYLSPCIECTMAFIISLLIYTPIGSLKLHACSVSSISDWYSMFYNPYIDYYKKLNCTQEIVYPLFSIVFVYIAFTTIIMIIIRPIVVNRLITVDKLLRKSLNNVTFTSLYFYPILSVMQAIGGGLIYYSYPVLGLIGFLITNAIHLNEAFYEKNEYSNSFKEILKNCLLVYKSPRNVLISILHVLFFTYSIVSLTRFEDLISSILMLLLTPLPIIFFLISYKFTNPEYFKNY